jgi:hypothetical protein
MHSTLKGQPTGIEWEKDGEALKSLYEQWKPLTDKRKRRGIGYPFAGAVVMLVVAKLSGEDEGPGTAEWLKWRAAMFVDVLGGTPVTPPHQSTQRRLLNGAVDIQALEPGGSEYVRAHGQPEERIALDGKTLRGTMDAGSTQGQQWLSAYGTDSGLVIRPTAVDSPENEISAAPELLKGLEWQGRLFEPEHCPTAHGPLQTDFPSASSLDKAHGR